MTFFTRRPRPARIQRSELAVPATSERFFLKAANGAADVIFLDLEDAVAPSKKVEARGAAIKALNEIDWNTKTVAVRVNSLDTEWGLRDILEIVANSPRLDMILIPKVGTAFDVAFVDALLTSLERETGRERKVGIEILIESAIGIANVEQIAQASDRLEAMIFGVGDYSIDVGTAGMVIGASDPRYVMLSDPDAAGQRQRHWNDQYHFAIARMANACRANGIRAIDGPYANYGDTEGYRQVAMRAAALGCEGKWAIHPTQVDLANEVFSPSAAEIAAAEDMLRQLEEATSAGKGAFGRDGVLIDMAYEKIALGILRRHEMIEAMRGQSAG